MRILILINHNTAAKFFCEMFNKLGYETYIPFICNVEKYVIHREEVLKYRSISLEHQFVRDLDNFNFYNQNPDKNQLNKVIDIINKNFDIVLTLHVVSISINLFLSISNLRVYFIFWGDDSRNNQYHIYNNNIIKNKNKFYFIAHPFLVDRYVNTYNIPRDKYIYVPLGINDISKHENSYNPNNNNILLIISRLKLVHSSIINFIVSLANMCPNINFHIYGKSNEGFNFSQKNIIIHKSLTNEDDLYDIIKTYRLAININHHQNMIQYSSVEYSCINIPNFYQKGSGIDSIIKTDNFLRFENTSDLAEKIKSYLKDENNYKDVKDNNNRILYDFYKIDSLVDKYKLIF